MDSNYTIIIVDDSPEDRFLLKRILGRTGLSLVVIEAGNGAEGIELLTTSVDELEVLYPNISTPAVLFLDINMPLMNGWEFIEELERRQSDVTLDPTVLMMYSTSGDSIDRSKATKYDAIANYIVKGESTPGSLKETIVASCV